MTKSKSKRKKILKDRDTYSPSSIPAPNPVDMLFNTLRVEYIAEGKIRKSALKQSLRNSNAWLPNGRKHNEFRKSHRYSTVNKQKDYKMKKRKRKILEKIFENTIVLTRNYEVSPEDSAPFLIKTASALGLLDKKDAKGYLSVLSNKRLD